MKNWQLNGTDGNKETFANKWKIETASEQFQEYWRLTQLIDAYRADGAPQAVWAPLSDERDNVMECLAKARSNGADPFEKLIVWRCECLEIGRERMICFNDLFPLGAYFNYIDNSYADGVSGEGDGALRELLYNN